MPWRVIAIVLAVYCGLNAAAFVAMWWDKHRARRNRSRLSEKRLHGLSVLSGGVGTLIGRAVFRHKSQRAMFLLVPVAAFTLHVGAWAGVWWYVLR